MANLYELTKEQAYLYDLLSSGEGVDTETGEIDPRLQEQLEITEGQLKEKIKSCGIVYKQLAADAKMLKEEEDRIKVRRQRAERNAELLKGRLEESMCAIGMTAFDDPKVSISFRKSCRVDIFSEKYLPEEYIIETVERKPDKKAITEALKNNELVPGAVLEEHLNIQIK